MVLKSILIWGSLLFVISRFLYILLSYILTLVGLGIGAAYLSFFMVLIFSGLAGYFTIRSTNSKNQTYNLSAPILVGTGIVVIALIRDSIFSVVILRRLGPGYSLGLFRLIAAIIGGYFATWRSKPRQIS